MLLHLYFRLQGPIGTFFSAQRGVPTWLYWVIWSVLSFGIWILLYLQVRALSRNITSVTQQQLVQLILNGRLFFIDHPELAEPNSSTETENFIVETGGWSRYFLRRNVISTLELLYFQRKAGAIEKGFFVSHCNHIRPWFEHPDFIKTWEKSRNMHVSEFSEFVDALLKARSAEAVDPRKQNFRQIRKCLRLGMS